MLRWAIIFFTIAAGSAVMYFTRLGAGAGFLIKATFTVSAAAFVILLTLGLFMQKRSPEKM